MIETIIQNNRGDEFKYRRNTTNIEEVKKEADIIITILETANLDQNWRVIIREE